MLGWLRQAHVVWPDWNCPACGFQHHRRVQFGGRFNDPVVFPIADKGNGPFWRQWFYPKGQARPAATAAPALVAQDWFAGLGRAAQPPEVGHLGAVTEPDAKAHPVRQAHHLPVRRTAPYRGASGVPPARGEYSDEHPSWVRHEPREHNCSLIAPADDGRVGHRRTKAVFRDAPPRFAVRFNERDAGIGLDIVEEGHLYMLAHKLWQALRKAPRNAVAFARADLFGEVPS